MKIALLHLYLATESGDPRMVLSIAKECQAQGHKVKVYCAEFNPLLLENLHRDLEIIVVPPPRPLVSVLGASSLIEKVTERIRRNKLYAAAANRIFEKLDDDFDFVISENDPTYLAAARYKKKRPQAKTVWIMNNPPFYHSRKKNPLNNFGSWLLALHESRKMRQVAKQIDLGIVYDQEYKKKAEALGYRIKLIGNPLNPDYFHFPVKRIDKSQPIQILAAGALSPARRYEDAVTAIATLKKSGYNVRLIIVCKDYWSDKSYRHKFEEHIRSSGAAASIDARFDGVDEKEMLNLLRNSHISLAPQLSRVWIVTSCEAMASGMPALISNKTAMTGVFKDHQEVLFFDPNHPDQIADKIKELIDKPDLFAQIASTGQRYVRENLSFSGFVREMLS